MIISPSVRFDGVLTKANHRAIGIEWRRGRTGGVQPQSQGYEPFHHGLSSSRTALYPEA
jgi:hypothetical protein